LLLPAQKTEHLNLEIRNFEFERNEPVNSVVGRLRKNILFWKKDLLASNFVLSIIEFGYYMPFLEHPPLCHTKNNKSSLKHPGFVEQAINALLEKGCIIELEDRPYCCNPLTVAERPKLRLVIDLRHVNKYIKTTKFRYEDLSTLSEMFKEGDYFTKFDLTSGYHHIDIHPEHWKYLGFEWLFSNGQTRFFHFVVLPFGLSPACYVFTKVLRPLVKKWRSSGIRSILYIDDGINGSNSYKSALISAKAVFQDLENSGFVINIEKSDFEPKQTGEWLGSIIDTRNMTFTVPKRKIEKLKHSLSNTLSCQYSSAKQLSKIAGQLSSMHLAIGPLVRLFTRNIYRTIENATDWFSSLPLDPESKSEVLFWHDNIDSYNGYTFKPHPVTTKLMFTDASDKGYGGFVCERLNQKICSGSFSSFDMTTSSTMRELLAVKYVLSSFGNLLINESVKVHIDNFNASHILSVGSSKKHLHEIALDIFKFCLQKNIKLTPQWIPREQNQFADLLSKVNDTDDWGIDFNSFSSLNRKYGPFTVDRFANEINKRVSVFNSKFYCPGTSAVDSFTQNWQHENNWICPPVKLIGSVFKHMDICKCRGTVLIPLWKSAYFWPLIYPDGIRLASFIKDFTVLNPFYISYGNNSIFSGYVDFQTIALYISFE